MCIRDRLISSVNVKNPDQVLDNTMILSQYVDILSLIHIWQAKDVMWSEIKVAKYVSHVPRKAAIALYVPVP